MTTKAQSEARKLALEADALEAEILHKKDLRALEITAKKLEIKKFQVENARAEQDRQAHYFELLEKQEKDKVRQASNDYHRVYRFTDEVTEESVGKCIDTVDLWSRVNPGAEIQVVFTSPGGSVYDGLALVDHLRSLSRQGHRIVTGCEGFAASMAGILLQAGDWRWIGKESYILIHEFSTVGWGTVSEISDNVVRLHRVQDRVIRLFLDRAAEADAEKLLTPTQFRAKWKKTDWWLDSDESRLHGFVDEIR